MMQVYYIKSTQLSGISKNWKGSYPLFYTPLRQPMIIYTQSSPALGYIYEIRLKSVEF